MQVLLNTESVGLGAGSWVFFSSFYLFILLGRGIELRASVELRPQPGSHISDAISPIL